jgi:thiol-disulfide isomerase/thioredoxin
MRTYYCLRLSIKLCQFFLLQWPGRFKNYLFILYLSSVVSLPAFCQRHSFELSGAIAGNYNESICLFFKDEVAKRDSLCTQIVNGKFLFKGNIHGPVVGNLVLKKDRSTIADLYIENSNMFVTCKVTNIYLRSGDTLLKLEIISVKGSKTEKLKSSFYAEVSKMEKTITNEDEKVNKYYQQLSTFVKTHRTNKVSAYLLAKSDLPFEKSKALFNLLDPAVHNEYEGKLALAAIKRKDRSRYSEPGQLFKDMSFEDSLGNMVETRNFRGKIVLINFWASWCLPCRKEHPALAQLYNDYKEHDFIILNISLDKEKDKNRWLKAIQEDALSWPQLWAPEGFDSEIVKYYGFNSIPFNVLLDKSGKIIDRRLYPDAIKNILNKEIK